MRAAPRPGPDGVVCLTRSPTAAWSTFTAAVARRLEAGRVVYGDRSFTRPPGELVAEIEEELLDVCAWSFILWHRVQGLPGDARRGSRRNRVGGSCTSVRDGAGGSPRGTTRP